MPFSVGPKGTTPNSASPASSRSNLRSAPTNLLPSTSKRQKSPDERSSLLRSDGDSHTPRRSWTADLDAAQTDEDGRTLGPAGDRGKDNDADASSFTNSMGGR
jgi:hypothetical protein